MGRQLIVAINRAYGSGGHEIGKILADRLGIGFLDREMLDEVAAENGLDAKELRPFDEKPRNPFLSRSVMGYSNSPEEAVAKFQFDMLLKKAEAGESFVVIGRCADQVLKDYPGLVKVFVTGRMDARIRRIMRIRNMDRPRARAAIRRHDRTRRHFHDAYAARKWNDMSAYDLVLSSSPLGTGKAAEVLESYLKIRGMI